MKELIFQISVYKINASKSRVIFAKNYRSAKMKQSLRGWEKPRICIVQMRKLGTWCKFSPQLVFAFYNLLEPKSILDRDSVVIPTFSLSVYIV